MNITKQYLSQVIKEEIKVVLHEALTDPVPNFREIIRSYKPVLDRLKNVKYDSYASDNVSLVDLAQLYKFFEKAYRVLEKIAFRNRHNKTPSLSNDEGAHEAQVAEAIRDTIKSAFQNRTKYTPHEEIPKLGGDPDSPESILRLINSMNLN